jgi:hypothetical protein
MAAGRRAAGHAGGLVAYSCNGVGLRVSVLTTITVLPQQCR